MHANLTHIEKNLYDSSNWQARDKRVRLSRYNHIKLCDKKVNTAQFDWVTCAELTNFMYKIKPEELYILSCEKGRGRTMWRSSGFILYIITAMAAVYFLL